MVTTGTYQRAHLFRTDTSLDLLEGLILTQAKRHGWRLEAWAVFSNHYHFVAHGPPSRCTADSLVGYLRRVHTLTALALDTLDATPGRTVWHNYWDTRLTYHRSYLARLNYVDTNPVMHGLGPVPNQYRWCSARWFERTARPATVRMIYGMKTDQVSVRDDF